MTNTSTPFLKLTLKALSQHLDMGFGTSGLRGTIEALSPEICYAYTKAFIQNICQNATHLAIAMDLRPSSPLITKACIQAIEDCNVNAIYCGTLATPALAHFAMSHKIPCIMVTGSHIPFDRNGLKFYRLDGEINKQDEETIQASEITLSSSTFILKRNNLPPIDSRAAELFTQRYCDIYKNHSLEGLSIGFYQHSSVARDHLTHLLEYLGARVTPLDRCDHFVALDTESISEEDALRAKHWIKAGKFDALISTDGDGDRPLLGDEKGNWIRGDILGLLTAKSLNAKHVVTPINANSDINETRFSQVLTTKIGSPFVIEGLEKIKQDVKQHQAVGFEANGGFLLASNWEVNGKTLVQLATRDSYLPLLSALFQCVSSGQPISHRVNHLVSRYTASNSTKTRSSELNQTFIEIISQSKDLQKQLILALYSVKGDIILEKVNRLDGFRMTLSNQDIIHIRASGNAPELRCYAESQSAQLSESLVKNTLEWLRLNLMKE